MFGLPLISPTHRWYGFWTTIIVILDSTYTAFCVPILVGFQVSDVTWTWGAYVDLVCGASLRIAALILCKKHRMRAHPAAGGL